MTRILALLLVSAPALAQFTPAGQFFVASDSPGQPSNLCAFVNTYTGEGLAAYPPGVWRRVDLSRLVPADAVAVLLTSMIIITHGTGEETADLTLGFRRAGSTVDNYTAQTCCTRVGDGSRTSYSVAVPLGAARDFEMKWTRTPAPANWPAWSSYGLNIRVAGYWTR